MLKTASFLLFTSFVFLANSCKKIDTPNDQSKILIGKWQYKSNSGGFSGSGGSTKFNSENSIEFTEKGVYIVFKGTKVVDKQHFTFKVDENNSGSFQTSIVYRRNNRSSQTFQISGNKLVLSDNGSDGYSYTFVRK